MPKQSKTINFFHGGLNTNSDPRDLRNEESPELQDVAIDKLGKLTLLGKAEVGATPTTPAATSYLNSKGFFVMGSDVNLSNGSHDDDLLFAYDSGGGTGQIDASDDDGDNWQAGIIETGIIDPIFYSVDGNLRVADKNKSVYPKWFGYIDSFENKFNGLNADSGDIKWYVADQEIEASTSEMNVIFTTPYSGSDDFSGGLFKGVNSSDSELIGPLVAGHLGFPNEFLEAGSIGLRVGVQYNTPLETSASSWSNTELLGGTASNSTTSKFPFFEDTTIKFNSSGNGNEAIINDTTGPNFVIDETQAFVFGFFMTASELEKIDKISVELTDINGTDYLKYSFPSISLLEDNRITLISCLTDNLVDATASFGSTFGSWKITVTQKDGNSGNATPTFSMTPPVIAPSTELGYQQGEYTFAGTWLYDDSKQESLPDDFFGGYSFSKEKIKIIGSPLLFNFDIYVNPFSDRIMTTGNGVEQASAIINSTGHGLIDGDVIKFEGLKNITTPADNTLYYVVEATANTFQISTTKGGSPLAFVGTDDPIVSSTATSAGLADNDIELDAADTAADNAYQDQVILLDGGTGANQQRKVISNTNANKILETRMDWQTAPDATTTYKIGVSFQKYLLNKRITGSRIYWKLDSLDDHYLVGELDFVEGGFKWFPDGDDISYDLQNTSNTEPPVLNNTVMVKNITPATANSVDTFKNINGFSANAKYINARYKAVCVHGRRAYIGNIKRSNGKTQADTMVKSLVNKFDVFPENRGEVDVVIRDGESIVALETYADRILQFKEKSLYVINVSENVEYLEDTYRNKGVLTHHHITKTDMGIAWFNKFGVYLYDGKGVMNLLEKDAVRLIDESYWESFISTNFEQALIGYIPKKRQLLIANSGEDVAIYDFVLRAWTIGTDRIIETNNRTNFQLIDEDLVYLSDTTDNILHTWNLEPAEGDFTYISRDDDFGVPNTRKKIYKMYVSYTSGATNVPSLTYGVNGDTAINSIATGGFSTSENKWTRQEFTFGTDTNNCYSFQFKIDGTADAEFEINDITIVYRIKNNK